MTESVGPKAFAPSVLSSEYRAESGLTNHHRLWLPASVERGSFVAQGKDGQLLYVDPSTEVVIVRQGFSQGDLEPRQWIRLFDAIADQVSVNTTQCSKSRSCSRSTYPGRVCYGGRAKYPLGVGAETRMTNVIDIDELRFSYGTFEAVRGISLQVRRGELFALLGANGAGKTTTMEVLEGLQPATAGQVRVLGLDPIRDRMALRPDTGVMLQKSGLSDSLTVRETVELWRSLTAGPRAAAEAIELVGLTDKAAVAVAQLSGGEGRRLELALAVLGRPQLLFLDEPTTGMDPVSRRQTWEVVRELQREGATVLLTTHYLEEAEVLADRVAIMKSGQLVAVGTPDRVVGALPARISFRLPVDAPPVPELDNAVVEVAGNRVTYQSHDLQADLTDLLAWANGNAAALADLSARPASLEDVFMDIATTNGAYPDATTDQDRAEATR